MHDYAARLQKAVADRTAIGPLRRARPRHRLRRAAGAARRPRARSSAGSSASPAGPSRRRSGVDSPIYGFLEGANALDLGAPLDTSALIQPRCEPEIVFVLGRDLAGAARHRGRRRLPRRRASPSASRCSTPATATTSSRCPTWSPTTPRRAASSSARRCRPQASTCASSAWCSRRTARSSRRRPARRRWGTRPPRWRGWSARWRPTARACARATWCCPAASRRPPRSTAGDVVVVSIDRLGTLELAVR